MISVCQPTVPVLAAISLMASARRADAAHDDDDGRPDRRPQEPDRGQLPGDEQELRVVREQRDLPRAGELSGRRPRGLSGLPAARGLRRDEPGPPPDARTRTTSRPGARRRRRRRTRIATSTTSTTPCSTWLPSTTSTRSGPCSRTSRSSTAPGTSKGQLVRPQDIKTTALLHDRRRTRRHLRRRPDARRARPVHRHSGERRGSSTTTRKVPATTASSRAVAGARRSIRSCAISSLAYGGTAPSRKTRRPSARMIGTSDNGTTAAKKPAPRRAAQAPGRLRRVVDGRGRRPRRRAARRPAADAMHALRLCRLPRLRRGDRRRRRRREPLPAGRRRRHRAPGRASPERQVAARSNPECGVEAPRRLAVIDEAACIGCTLCLKACPADAIVGAAKRMHTVSTTLCTGCELCLPVCPVDCIALVEASDGRTGWSAWSAARRRDRPDVATTRIAAASTRPRRRAGARRRAHAAAARQASRRRGDGSRARRAAGAAERRATPR